jgi:hypothetical protein
MTAGQIIREIRDLPPGEQAKVVQFAYRLDAELHLSGAELSALAERMAASTDPLEAGALREEITRGFYGVKPSAWDSATKSPAGPVSTLTGSDTFPSWAA